jgi:hypothetical protein
LDQQYSHFCDDQTLRDAFVKTDEQFLQRAQARDLINGSTAVCALLPGDGNLFVSNLGDSRALLVELSNTGTPILPPNGLEFWNVNAPKQGVLGTSDDSAERNLPSWLAHWSKMSGQVS